MKLQQIQYVVEVARSGSISQAAKNLFTAQSNISNSLKTLEQELGYPLFSRSNSGVQVTSQGKRFIELAETVYSLTSEMSGLTQAKTVRRTFSVVSEHYSFCHNAFSRLCREYQDSNNINLELLYSNKSGAGDYVLQEKCEIGIIMISPIFSDAHIRKLCASGLSANKIRNVQLFLRLAKNHPLLASYHPGDTFDFHQLAQYPYADYTDTDGVLTYILNDIIGISLESSVKHINIFDREYKKRIISTTNAWTIGTGYCADDEATFDGVRIPVPGIASEIICIQRKDHLLSAEGERYLTLLNDELNKLSEYEV